MDLPFKLSLFDKAMGKPKGWLGDPIRCEFTPRHNAVGSMSVTFAAGHPKAALLLTPGSRLSVDYHGSFLQSGMMRSWQQDGGQTDGTVTVQYSDDMVLWWEILGWPNPTQLINAQNTGGVKEDKVTGAAETVAKTFMTRNGVTRLGLPLTVATTHGYGSTITVPFRMVPLADNLMTVVDQAGVGLSVQQSGTGYIIDAYQPRVYPHVLTERSGIVIPNSVGYTEATMTRTVVAGPGVGSSREWLLRVDSARETALNRKIEVLTDASSSEVTTEREKAGDAALVAAGPTAGFSMGLSETAYFRYGDKLRVGDIVPIDIGGGNVVTDILREATLTWDRENGLTVRPAVGERTNDPIRSLVGMVARTARRVRGLTTNDSSGSSGDGGTF